MKRLNHILIVLFLLTSIISCEKNKKNNEETLKKETISAKWSVTGISDYESFEFNKSGNYIVVKNTTTKSTSNQIVLFGTYEIIDSKTISLSDFGTIKISNLDENTIIFTITLDSNPNNGISINAAKQDKITSSTKTELLCRTWELVSFGGTETNSHFVLFSDAGTYFFQSISRNGIGTWKWCDSEENKIAFTVSHELNCDGIETIINIVLTNDSFTGIDLENGEPYEMIMNPK